MASTMLVLAADHAILCSNDQVMELFTSLCERLGRQLVCATVWRSLWLLPRVRLGGLHLLEQSDLLEGV